MIVGYGNKSLAVFIQNLQVITNVPILHTDLKNWGHKKSR